MLNHGKIVFACIMSFSWVLGAGVTATVDTTEVPKGTPLTLHIKATGGSAAFPNISMVADAPVVRTSTSSSRNMRMVNGSITSEMTTIKSIQFIPTHDMTIPSYRVNISGKSYTTNPIDIKVVKANTSSPIGGGLFSITMKANKHQISVGESLMVTVLFSLRRDAGNSPQIQYTPPDLSGFLVVDTEEQKAHIQGNYQVQEVRYILTAQSEGNFTISPAQAKLGVPDRSKRDIFGMSFGTKWYQAASNALDIEVLPQTVESDLIGEFSIQATLDDKKVKSNKPVNLTVHIEGKGNLAGFEYPDYEIDGVTVYSDEAKIDTKVVNGELYSIYTKSFAFISDEDFRIPARTFSVYNSKQKQLEELKVQAFDVKIEASKSKNTHGVVQSNTPQITQPKERIVEQQVEVQTIAWWMLVLSFVSGVLLMYVIRFIPTRKAKPYKQSEALKILYGHMGEDEEVEEMVRKLYAKKNGDKSVEIDKRKLRQLVERFR